MAGRTVVPRAAVERYRAEHQGGAAGGWGKRKAEDYQPGAKAAYYRAYRARRKAAQAATAPADEENHPPAPYVACEAGEARTTGMVKEQAVGMYMELATGAYKQQAQMRPRLPTASALTPNKRRPQSRREALTTAQAGFALGMTTEAVRRLVEAGTLAAEKIEGRWWINRAAVHAYRVRHTAQTAPRTVPAVQGTSHRQEASRRALRQESDG